MTRALPPYEMSGSVSTLALFRSYITLNTKRAGKLDIADDSNPIIGFAFILSIN